MLEAAVLVYIYIYIYTAAYRVCEVWDIGFGV